MRRVQAEVLQATASGFRSPTVPEAPNLPTTRLCPVMEMKALASGMGLRGRLQSVSHREFY